MCTVEGENRIFLDEAGNEVLRLTEHNKLNKSVLELNGTISVAVSQDFESELVSALNTHNQIVVDFVGVTGISGAGLRSLLNLQKLVDGKRGSKLQLLNMNDTIRAIFRDLGYIDLFEIAEVAEEKVKRPLFIY